MNQKHKPLFFKLTSCLIFLLFAVFFIAPQKSFADPWIHPIKPYDKTGLKTFDLGLDIHFYGANSNFNLNGENIPVSGVNIYSRTATDFSLKYGLTSDVTLFARLSVSNVSLDSMSFSKSQFGFSDQSLGLSLTAFEKETEGFTLYRIDLQGQFDFPFYDNDSARASQSPLLGDQSYDLTAMAFGTARLTHWIASTLEFVGGAGYTYRTQNYSAHIPWLGKLSLKPYNRGLFIEAGLNGITSLQSDTAGVTTPYSNTSLTSNSGGVYFISAFQPSLINGFISAGFAIHERLKLQAALSQSLAGRNAPSGTLITLGIQISLGGPKNIQELKASRSNKGFVTYSLNSKVLSQNDRMHLVKIDKGLNDGVERGQIFDIFKAGPQTESEGTLTPIARAKVTDVKASESALMIQEYFEADWINEGDVAKRVVP